MSVQATTWVWEHSQSGGNARLVLLAIADAADADGDNAWPSQTRLAAMARVSVRTVRRLVAELIMLGELEMEEYAGGTTKTREDRRPHLYRLPLVRTGGQPCPPGKRRSTGGHGTTNGRTRHDERADTVVPLTPIPLNTQISNPSGGTTADAAGPSLDEVAPIHDEEEPVVKQAPQDTLFDVPASAKAQKAESPSARTVVAAFVDSYRQHHSGADPVKSAIGRVARDAKAILDKGDASPEELTEAARGMGEGIWNNLAVALNIHRQNGQKRRGFTAGTPARVHTHPLQQEAAARVEKEEYQQLLTDDDLVRWVAQDPVEVEKWTSRYPELGQRFSDVA